MQGRSWIATIAALTLGSTALFDGAAAARSGNDARTAPVCETGAARIDRNFPSGAFAECATSRNNRFSLTIAPEDEGRINCSAWYAFRVSPQRSGRISVELNYTTCGHRYWPKVSHDGVNWTALPASAVTIEGTGAQRKARLLIRMEDRPVFVAAQEILVPSTYDAWFERMETAPFAHRALLGHSAEGRAIESLTLADPALQQRETVVLIGRQHPPEVTGALVMFPFVETLMGESALAQAYRARFQTLVVPLLNPDGVVRGFWRHNTGGLDLNRDWGPFTQTETRLMQGLLQDIDRDPQRRLRVMIDFHSTNRDVFYTIPDDLPTDPPMFTKNWLDLFQQRMPGYKVERDAQHNVDAPVSKAYVYDAYGVPGITFEIGDNTDRELIQQIGRESAIAMMMTLLETEPPAPDNEAKAETAAL